jgi:hypothetical protein
MQRRSNFIYFKMGSVSVRPRNEDTA